VPVGIAASDTSGFIAAISIDGAPQLLAGVDGKVSVRIGDQLDLCSGKGPDAAADPEEICAALETIQQWVTNQRAAKTAGVDGSTARDRRKIAARLDSLIESAPPHLRNTRISLAALARGVVTAPQCSAVERDLSALLDANLPDDEWLAAIAGIDTRQATSANSGSSTEVHAVLILRPRLCQLPPDPESP
jgi:hypothetical protein